MIPHTQKHPNHPARGYDWGVLIGAGRVASLRWRRLPGSSLARPRPREHHAESLGRRADHFSRAPCCPDLVVHVLLADRGVALRPWDLRLETDEQAIGADDDVGEAGHHVFTTVNLEAEETMCPKMTHDFAGES